MGEIAGMSLLESVMMLLLSFSTGALAASGPSASRCCVSSSWTLS